MCREMIQRWYNEIKNYDFDKGTSKSPKTSYKHFSQIVWANTAELGVGTAISNKYGFITVARYKPMGNEGGVVEFIKNVPPEGGQDLLYFFQQDLRNVVFWGPLCFTGSHFVLLAATLLLWQSFCLVLAGRTR